MKYKTIGAYKSVQNIPYCKATVDMKVGIRILAQMMYVSYLQRELSRVMALNGIYGKDVQLTGQDATKRVTKQELDNQIALVETLLHRMKDPAYG